MRLGAAAMDALQLVFGIIVVVLMLGLGAAMSPKDFKAALRMWKAPLVAVLCQFILMPLISFGLALGLGVTKEQGLSMLVVGCSPGGSTSNLFAYYSRADLPLSILATSLSTLLSVAFMPLCMFIYSGPFTDETVEIPLTSLVMPLSLVILPVMMGMGIRHFSQKVALWMEKAASILGTIFLLAALVMGVVSNSHLFTDHWKLWLASALLMPLGSTLGYVNARVAQLPPKACRTICLETGLQNSTLALTILAFSFGDTESFGAVSVFPLLYSLFLLIDGVLITILFRFLSRNEGIEDAGNNAEGKEKAEEPSEQKPQSRMSSEAKAESVVSEKDGSPDRNTSVAEHKPGHFAGPLERFHQLPPRPPAASSDLSLWSAAQSVLLGCSRHPNQ